MRIADIVLYQKCRYYGDKSFNNSSADILRPYHKTLHTLRAMNSAYSLKTTCYRYVTYADSLYGYERQTG